MIVGPLVSPLDNYTTHELLNDFWTFIQYFSIYDYVTLHVPHMTLGIPQITSHTFLLTYIITLHLMIWHETHTQIDQSDDTYTSYNFTMMTWTS